MRYTITSTHLNYFRKEGKIDFEGLFDDSKFETIEKLLEEALNNHSTGRDLHRENPPLLSALHFSRISQVASPLFGKKRLRVGFTQYKHFPQSPVSIEEISSITESCGGCLFNFENKTLTFFDKNFPIDFTNFPHSLLIVFVTDKGRYRYQEKDPYTHQLKKLGYGFGDLITEETHPLICK